jgi:phage baseplate assembly protein W
MASLAVKLPLTRDSIDGFGMIKTFRVLTKQNFKMLLLTNPGERVMMPLYGVGMQQYLFENLTSSTFAKIETKILEQANTYMPNIVITEIVFNQTSVDSNVLEIKIAYSIPILEVSDLLHFTI